MTWPLFWFMMEGLLRTLILTGFGAVLGLFLAFAVGIARTSDRKVVRGLGLAYVEVFRGMSPLIVLFWLIFVLPELGYQLDPLFAGVIALALNISAYAAEVVRGGIRGVPAAQLEAATALNFTAWQRMRKVVLPQAVVSMIPTFCNNLIELLKASSLVSIVYISDFTFSSQVVRQSTGDTETVYTMLLIGYAVVAMVLIAGMKLLETKAARAIGREPEPGFIRRAIPRGRGGVRV